MASGVFLLFFLYIFGRTIPATKKRNPSQHTSDKSANIQSILASSKQKLTNSQQEHLRSLENSIVRGDVKEQQIKVYHQLASFWKDSAHSLVPYAYYIGEAAKLENSEKSLTFAAQFYLEGLPGQTDPAQKKWMASEAKELFEKALTLNPNNDSLKVGLGSCYLFGNISETPMEGIRIIREVADRDPDNMYAQLMLGLGGILSGQLDKAIERLLVVAAKQPANIEVKLMLAEAYERKGDKRNAMKWYEDGKELIKDPDMLKEIDHRIKLLKN